MTLYRPIDCIPSSRRFRSALAALLPLFAGLAPSAARAQNITVWSGYPEMAPYYEHVAKTLSQKHPKLNVKVEAITLREHEKRVALALTSQSSATIVMDIASTLAKRYIDNDLLAKAPPEMTAFIKDPANFSPFFVDAVSSGGVVFGMPLFRGQDALYYNVEMFAAAGLDGPPRTMEDFTRYSEKLTKRGPDGKPVVSGWSLRLSGGGAGIAEKFGTILFQYGGRLVAPAGDGMWRANYNNEAGRKALGQYLENLYKLKTVSMDMPGDAEAFERQQTAMFIRESWVIADIKAKAPNLKYATATLPVGAGTLPFNLYVNASAGKADAEAAWMFAKAANEPENLIWMLKNTGWLPNRSGVDFSSVTDVTPGFNAFLKFPENYKLYVNPAIAPIDEIMTRLAARLVQAYANPALAGDTAAIDAFLASAAEETNSILKREGLLAP